jgi:hypothetical protein
MIIPGVKPMLGKRHRHHYQNDSAGLNGAVRQFNKHNGPARVFYNRHSKQFFVNCYEPGEENRFGPMLDSLDIVELYRKTDGSIQVTTEELKYFEANLQPFRIY